MTNRPPTKPEDLFRVEKERALTVRNSQHARLLAEAKAAFDKLMAEGQAARKSGRPRKHPLPPLKTSSARPAPAPIKPFAPPAAVLNVAAPEAVQSEAGANVAKPTSPTNSATAKSATAKSATAKSATATSAKATSAKTKSVKTKSAKTKSAKAKPKAKRSTRR
jgi:hypothetical protein